MFFIIVKMENILNVKMGQTKFEQWTKELKICDWIIWIIIPNNNNLFMKNS